MAAVRNAGITSSWFRVNKGVRQGCVISPCLFNILAEMVMRRVLENWNSGFKIGGITINNLRYADDIFNRRDSRRATLTCRSSCTRRNELQFAPKRG